MVGGRGGGGGSVWLDFFVQGGPEEPETGLRTSACCSTARGPVTLARVREAFPYEGGTFHFRLKVGDSTGKSGHVWLDLSREDEDVWELASNLAGSSGGRLTLRVLPLSLDGGGGGGVAVGESEWKREDLGPRLRLEGWGGGGQTAAVEDASEGGASFHGAGVGMGARAGESAATSIAKTTAQVAKMGLGGAMKLVEGVQRSLGVTSSRGSIPSPDALESLFELSGMLSTSFSSAVEGHMKLLRELWSHLFPGATFALPSPRWREAGFKSETVHQDLKSVGLLSLHCMCYFAAKKSGEASRIMLVAAQEKRHHQGSRGQSSSTYPFAIVANNVVLMLEEVVGLKGSQFVREKRPYWEVFCNLEGFYEVFCWCLLRIDRDWVHQRADRSQFGPIISNVKTRLEQVLSNGPKSFDEFLKMSLLT